MNPTQFGLVAVVLLSIGLVAGLTLCRQALHHAAVAPEGVAAGDLDIRNATVTARCFVCQARFTVPLSIPSAVKVAADWLAGHDHCP